MPEIQTDLIILGDGGGAEGEGRFTRGQYQWNSGAGGWTGGGPGTGDTPVPLGTGGGGTASDYAWLQAAIDRIGSAGGKLRILPSAAGNEYMSGAPAADEFSQVSGKSVGVECDVGANFSFRGLSGTATSMIRFVNAPRSRWKGGYFHRGQTGGIANQSFLAFTGTSHNVSLEDIEFLVDSTNPALRNFWCVRFAGSSVSSYFGPMRSPTIRNLSMQAKAIQQTVAVGSQYSNGGAYADFYGGGLLRLDGVRSADVSGLHTWADNTLTNKYGGALLLVLNDENSTYSNLRSFGCNLFGASGDAGTLVQVGDASGNAEGGHSRISGLVAEQIEARYLVDFTPAQFNVLSGVLAGRCGVKAGVHADLSPASGTLGRELTLGPSEFHNINDDAGGVYSAFGFPYLIEHTRHVNFAPHSFELINQDRSPFRILRTATDVSLRMNEHTFSFNTGVATFYPASWEDYYASRSTPFQGQPGSLIRSLPD